VTAVTPELIVDGLRPVEPRLSPDGRLVAFVVAPAGRPDEQATSAIWLAPADGAAPARKLTAGVAEDQQPRWSADGRAIYFLSDRVERGKQTNVYRLSLDGGEAEALTD
jgi:Tol biopolymer transport system component